MKRLDGSKNEMALVAFVVALVFGGSGNAKAGFIFGKPTNLGPTINSPVDDGGACISPNGLEFYLYSFLEGGTFPICRAAQRETTEDPWPEAVSLEPPLKRGGASCFSSDGLSLYFDSDRSSTSGGVDMWVATRASLFDPWSDPLNLGPSVNSPVWDMGASVSTDGLELFFCSGRPEVSEDWDIWVSARATVSDPWGQAVNLGPTVNSPVFDGHPFISPDGLILYLTSERSGGYGNSDIWMTRRATRDDAWGEPVNLGPPVNTATGEGEPYCSTDGSTLYFGSTRPGGIGGWDIWQTSILPIVDLNGDGIVDSADMCIVIDHWGTDEPLCDIGPMPWGDGVVDVQDLIVLAEHLFEEVSRPER